MINVTDSSKCCGCSACVNTCPVKCIVMHRDGEGFDYPVADVSSCISCGKCDDVCPMVSPVASSVMNANALRILEYESESSSGGVFPALASLVLEQGGVVVGAAFDSKLHLKHTIVNDKEGLARLRGSKYVQSEIGETYAQTRDLLDLGVNVLFSGTPCQIAGLLKYLNKPYDNLLTVDLACHGVPSPGVWEKYVRDSGMTGVRFRDKSDSWKRYIASTMGSTSSKIASPDMPPLPLEVIFSASQFMETSITTWPSRTKSLVRDFRTPAAEMMMSASRQTAAGSTVRVWQTVTVAFFAISIIAAGLPTTRERPMTTAFLPLQSMP